MSKETSAWLNNNVLIGFADKRGHAWHYRASDQGTEPNHYAGAVPENDVKRRLFNWTAELAPVTVRGKDAPNRVAVVASDNDDVLGVHRSGYRIHQYQDWLLNNVSTLIDGGLQIGSAGLLSGRAQAWVSIEVPDTITTPEGVQFRPNLIACTSHDGSLKTRYKRVITNVVCDNTMAAGLRETGQEIAYVHRGDAAFNVVNAREALAIVYTTADDFAAEVAALCRTEVSTTAWHAFLDSHVPMSDTKRGRTLAERKRSTLTRLWVSDDRVSPWRGTAWGVVQAVNTYEHHYKSVRNVSRPERNLARAIDGSARKLDNDTIGEISRILATV
jgi:phage/plasmid-like protein (TIGR03299 family)